jgi:hypothetical protein
MSASDLAIVASIVFLWGTLSARLERYDVTAPFIFVLAGLLLTHGPLAPHPGSDAARGRVPGQVAGPARRPGPVPPPAAPRR